MSWWLTSFGVWLWLGWFSLVWFPLLATYTDKRYCHTWVQVGNQPELNSCKYHLARWATKCHDYVPADHPATHHPPTTHPKPHGVPDIWEQDLLVIWKCSKRFLEGVWKVWRVSVWCLEGVWNVRELGSQVPDVLRVWLQGITVLVLLLVVTEPAIQ